MILVIAKVALLGFLVLAVGALAVRFVRRARDQGFPRPVDDPALAAYNRAVFGPRPMTPLPEGVRRDQADATDEDG